MSRYLVSMLHQWPSLSRSHHFILYFQNYIPDDDFLRHPNFELRLLRGPRFLRSHRIIAEQILMPAQLVKDNLDLFFATLYSAPLLYHKRRIVVAAWDISYSTHPQHYSFAHRISLDYFSRKSCQRASGVITCSRYDAQQIVKYYDVPEKKIATIYLAADSRFTSKRCEDRIDSVRLKYNLPKKFILSMGVIHNRRNIDILIESFASLKDDFPEFALVVVGRNSTQPLINIERLMRPMIDLGRALYLQWVEDSDLLELYHAAHSYVCTSTVDGETIMLKEAMQAGTPVITSPLLEGTIGGNGLIISDPQSVAETSKVLRQSLSEDSLTRHEMIRRGLEWTASISWERAAKESLEFLESRVE